MHVPNCADLQEGMESSCRQRRETTKDTWRKAAEYYEAIGDKRKTIETLKTGYEIHPKYGGTISFIHPFIHLVVCLTTGPKPLPKPALHIMRSRASSFKWVYPPLSLRLSSSFLRLLPRLPVTSIPPFTFPSLKYYKALRSSEILVTSYQYTRRNFPEDLNLKF
jgi:hypothetical protein